MCRIAGDKDFQPWPLGHGSDSGDEPKRDASCEDRAQDCDESSNGNCSCPDLASGGSAKKGKRRVRFDDQVIVHMVPAKESRGGCWRPGRPPLSHLILKLMQRQTTLRLESLKIAAARYRLKSSISRAGLIEVVALHHDVMDAAEFTALFATLIEAQPRMLLDNLVDGESLFGGTLYTGPAPSTCT